MERITKFNFPLRIEHSSDVSVCPCFDICSTLMIKMLCDRELPAALMLFELYDEN